jgi:hypothetical protein
MPDAPVELNIGTISIGPSLTEVFVGMNRIFNNKPVPSSLSFIQTQNDAVQNAQECFRRRLFASVQVRSQGCENN